jgi:hypothetical protein
LHDPAQLISLSMRSRSPGNEYSMEAHGRESSEMGRHAPKIRKLPDSKKQALRFQRVGPDKKAWRKWDPTLASGSGGRCAKTTARMETHSRFWTPAKQAPLRRAHPLGSDASGTLVCGFDVRATGQNKCVW